MMESGRPWGVQLAAPLLFMAFCLLGAFFLFWAFAAPYCGERLNDNMLAVAAAYFPAAGVMLLLLTPLWVVWVARAEQKRVYGPMKRLEAAARAMRDGQLDYPLPLAGMGLFSSLASAFEQMRARLQDSLRQTKEAEDERLSIMNSICHDLKTPVTSIIGYAEGIADGVADTPEKVASYAGIIAVKARKISALAEDLNYLSVLENAPPVNLEQINLSEWLEAFAREAGENAEVRADIEPGLFCRADRQKLERVFGNLADNAHKYGRCADGSLRLRFTARRHGGDIMLTMQDGGSGLPSAETRKVFERFYRSDPARSGRGGSGLGLSIARQIMALHGGKIWLRNAEDGGLLASVSLPARREGGDVKP
ncbi:MAG: HAMP domain-containing histidine kinase [Oscillospiraceae bacterium]|jgi:signal transduction histidine kinase|nr:HAMP domain-containing histidine kinase [Oscillospiraceae bacterium]